MIKFHTLPDYFAQFDTPKQCDTFFLFLVLLALITEWVVVSSFDDFIKPFTWVNLCFLLLGYFCGLWLKKQRLKRLEKETAHLSLEISHYCKIGCKEEFVFSETKFFALMIGHLVAVSFGNYLIQQEIFVTVL